MMDSIKQRTALADPWIFELELHTDGLVVNLVNQKTGDIRQKRCSIDTVGRRMFASEISRWRNEKYNPVLIKIKEVEG